MTTTIVFEVSFGQIAIFVSTLRQPFNDWTDRHIAQGFSWRPGSVSFCALEESGPHRAKIAVVDRLGPVRADAVRAIEVPFEVPEGGGVELGGITEMVPIFLPTGQFLLRFELLPTEPTGQGHVCVTFASMEVARFAVVRIESELPPDFVMLMTAEAAQH